MTCTLFFSFTLFLFLFLLSSFAMKKLFSTTLHHRNADIALLLLRVATSGFMLVHGLKKLAKYSDPAPLKFADPLGVGVQTSLALTVFAEVGCSVLLILGLATRLATIPLIITMAIVVVVVHSSDGFGKQELGLMYLVIYAVILLMGPGRYSVDHLLGKNKQ